MAINTIKATIQMRKGLERDFDADQMTAGEWAVSTDTKYVRMCFAPGIVLRMATYEGFELDMEEIRDILKECQDIQVAVDAMAKLAEKHKDDAEKSANLAESWAIGETGIRTGEDTNNSKYFSGLAEALVSEAEKLLDQAQKVITASTQGALIPGGTVAFQDLPTNPAVGFMYNISNDFTTDSRFEDGAGIFYRAGANVYWTSGGKWDVLIGTQVTGVKGAKESAYRVGNVNLTPANIGAMDAEAGSVLQEEVDNIRRDYWSLKGGTKILAGDDLNNYTTPGNYICDSATIVRSLLNSPFENATPQNTFNMKVYLAASNNESKKWVAQRIITWGTGQEFYRYALDENAQSFSEWIKISDNLDNYYSLTGGVEYTNDTQPDLNTIITPGNYFAYSVTISQSQIDNLHFPVTCSAYTLKVESTVGRGNYFTQIFKPYQSNYIVYERHKFGNSDWTNWTKIAGVSINNLTTASPGQGALDAYQGYVLKDWIDHYHYGTRPEFQTTQEMINYLESYSQNIANGSAYKAIVKSAETIQPFSGIVWTVEGYKHGESFEYQVMRSYHKSFPEVVRVKYQGVWSQYVMANKEYVQDNYKSLTQFTSIPEGADLKSSAYLVPGNYYCNTNQRAATLKNNPLANAFVLTVSYATGTPGYIMQTFDYYNGYIFVKRNLEMSSSTWGTDYFYRGDGHYQTLTIRKGDIKLITNIGTFSVSLARINNIVNLKLNIHGTIPGTNSYSTIFVIPKEYRPADNIIENYITQDSEKVCGITVSADGNVGIYTKGVEITGWIIRKNMTWITEN